MPEPETFDLDAAFARLEQDITTLSTAPGAGAAVARARRRRRTTVGAVAAAAVLAVGGAAIAQGVGHHPTSLQPASSLPSPAPLDAAALDAATAGWTSPWHASGSQAGQILSGPVSRCLDASPLLNQVADPTRASGDLSFTAGGAGAFGTLADYADRTARAETLWTGLVDTFSGCPTVTPGTQETWEGGEARSFAITGHGTTEHVWVARSGATIGLLWVSNAPDPVPAADDAAVASALVAALLDPASYTQSGSTSSSSSSSSGGGDQFVSIDDPAFAQAIAGWSSGWVQNGTKSSSSTLPCGVSDWQSNSSGGGGGSLGTNGEQEYDLFATPADAKASAATLVQELAACTDASYTSHEVAAPGGGTVAVVSATGAHASVVWVVQQGTGVAFVQIPAGDTPPPDSVTAWVGGMLHDVLKQTLSSSQGPPPVSVSSSAVSVTVAPPSTH